MCREINVDRVCLVCLQQDKEMVSIFEKPDGAKELAEIVNECMDFKFQQLESLPKQVCVECKKQALTAFKFKRKCEESYMLLIKNLDIYTSTKSVQRNAETQTDLVQLYELENHQNSKMLESAIECQVCKKYFKDVSNLQSHVSVFHQGIDICSSYQCYICNRQFTDYEQIREHLAAIHQTTDVNIKGSCKEQLTEQIDEFSSLPDIEEVDLKIFTENSNKSAEQDLLVYIKNFESMTDDEDNEPLSGLQNLKQSSMVLDTVKLEHEFVESLHDIETIAESPSEVVNKIQKTLPDNNHKSYEAKICPNIKSNLVHCEKCEKTFNHTSQLLRHVKTKHQEKKHKCNICEKNFKTATYLHRHVIMHSKKRYNCKECYQRFLTKKELHDHVKAVGHDKRLLCPECGLRCRTSNILMVHLRRHKGEKPFKCKFCSKGFPRSDDLKLHEKYHTGEKSHFCGTCGKGFQRKYNLKIHLRVHTGEKPYKCPHCPQAFAQGNDLKAHIRRHTGERFRCDLCDAAFLQGYQIRQHKLSEHGIRDEAPTQRVAKFTSAEAQKQQILQNSAEKAL